MKKNNNSISKEARRFVLISAIILVFLGLLVRLVYIQIVNYSKISRDVSSTVNKQSEEQAKRGDILDSSGKVLAESLQKYDLSIDPNFIRERRIYDDVKAVLAQNGIRVPKANIKDYGNTSFVWLASGLSEETAANIRKSQGAAGIILKPRFIRQYPEGVFLTHILGRVGADSKGLNGMEFVFNSELSGEIIKIKQYRDGRGRLLNEGFIDKSEKKGHNLTLTIDRNIQFIVEQEMDLAFKKNRAKRAVCIVQRPKTGEILAMAVLPEYSLSDKIADIDILKNFAVSDIFEPGSTFKIVALAAAIEEKKITAQDKFYLEDGKYKIADRIISDDHIIMGFATVEKIMEQSSNIGFIKIAYKLGENIFYNYIRKFGFFSITGIELQGESRGMLADASQWNALSLPNISFGQGIGVTALQIIGAFSAIANDGILMQPLIVKQIGDNIKDYKPKIVRRVVSADTAKEVKRILKAVVEKGTGQSAKVSQYTVGGKTGTAQKINTHTKEYSKYNYIASFCGMLPAMEPEIVILIVFDEPRGDYYAASIAAPVFSKIAKRTAEYLKIPKDK
ncbi:MAG: penicillin-binding protein 2 [Elusimicrobiota bacterium]|jgi:cell division protein FtsI (penicillin-binding protein 3)|nr:penicillin-binding protein 2 [Elusimicrobiota bacterium]